MTGIEDIEYFEPEDKFGVIKATVHKSGKLGFSTGAIKLIDFEKNKFFKIGKKKDSTDVLFLIPVDAEDDYTFKVLKAGDYYYLRIKRLLSQLGIDYRNENENISFDIDEVKENGKRYFKMLQKKKKANSMG
ncbi:MAG: hypothetical protein JSS93_04205 [Bacteroidetes bacterium]|nr:hypothetical protein [Bacteroidota bacterium]MBS1981704.1 hypothetical protein [Bacteroidota bacterium]